MQIKRQIPNVLWVCFSLLLATSISCEKVNRNVELVESDQEISEELSSQLNLDKLPDEIASNEIASNEIASNEIASNEVASNEVASNEVASNEGDQPSYEPPAEDKKPEVQTIEIPKSWKRLSQEHEIWIDKTAKVVIIAGEVCLNQGPLEMFICPQGTKEHESVISANALSSELHGALIFLGADPGKACSWDPEYRPAFGPTIEITLMWRDEQSKKTISKSARDWIRNVNTMKPLAHQWVFGGSEFWEDPDTKEQVYYGDSGEMICLSNFSTATIDLNVKSSQSNAGLLFEAFTENIPPLGTKVYAVIKPGKRIEPAKKIGEKPADGKAKSAPAETDAAKENENAKSADSNAQKAESADPNANKAESEDPKKDKADDKTPDDNGLYSRL